MSNTDVQRERLLANTKTWIHDFQGNISPFMVGAHENTASNMVPDVLTALTEYMYDEFGRDQRRWTAQRCARPWMNCCQSGRTSMA